MDGLLLRVVVDDEVLLTFQREHHVVPIDISQALNDLLCEVLLLYHHILVVLIDFDDSKSLVGRNNVDVFVLGLRYRIDMTPMFLVLDLALPHLRVVVVVHDR